MTGPSAAGRAGTADNVVGVEVTIDGMLVIADRLHLVDFPVTLGIRPNIPQEDLRDIVWEQVQRDLTAQGVLDLHGEPQPTVAEMVETLGRPDRTLEGRWWRRDIGGVMVRFVVCRRGDRHVIAARDGDMLVLQLVAPQVGLAGMVTAVLGPAEPANVEPLTGVATELAECTTASQLTQYGIAPASARVYAEIVGNPTGWVEIVASQRHPGGTTTQTDAAAGVLFRGSDGYEAARRGTVWHRRVPDRYPEVIVQAVSADDIVSAIRYATVNGHKVSVVSGGHSFAASHLRDGAVLLDVSRIDHASIDADKGRAVVGPGKGGSVLMAELEAQGLFFPGGHCRGVCLGGYLLQGGYGWNSRIYGPACESVIGLDVITADGAQIHCDADNHADLYWAARGAGPGFFGVVTSFYLKLYPRPATCGTSVYVYPFDLADEVFTWARAVSAEVDPRVELQALASRGEPSMGIDVPVISLASPAFADSPEEAEQALALFGTCPVVEQALVKVPYMPTDLPAWYDVAMTHYLSDHHYAVDNMWTSASAEDLLPGIRSILDTLPPHPAHFLWLNWGPCPPRQDMAYSIEADIYLALYGSWKDPADEAKYADWARSHMAAMSHLAVGIQLADENLGARPARFASDAAMAKLDRVRAEYDPDGLFNSWMGRI